MPWSERKEDYALAASTRPTPATEVRIWARMQYTDDARAWNYEGGTDMRGLGQLV